MIERDRVWWCWWRGVGGRIEGDWVACGYSRRAMDVREGVFERGRVRYREGAFDEGRGDGGDVYYVAAAPNSIDDLPPWGEGIRPVKIDIDLAARIGLTPPEFRDDLPDDREPTFDDVWEARDVLLSDARGPDPYGAD